MIRPRGAATRDALAVPDEGGALDIRAPTIDGGRDDSFAEGVPGDGIVAGGGRLGRADGRTELGRAEGHHGRTLDRGPGSSRTESSASRRRPTSSRGERSRANALFRRHAVTAWRTPLAT